MIRSLLLLTLLSLPARAAVHTVAVMPFENVSGEEALDWLALGIPETISNDLAAIGGIALIERLQLRKLMAEQKLQASGAVDKKTAVKVGKLLGADILVLGAFQKAGEAVRLTSRFVDVKSGGVLHSAKATGRMDDIFDVQDEIVKALARNLDITMKKSEFSKIAAKPTRSLEAYEHFGRGALLQAQQDPVGAVEELRKAAELDPGFTAAKDKFKEVFWSLEEGNHWTYAREGSAGAAFIRIDIGRRTTRRAGRSTTLGGQKVFSYHFDLEKKGALKEQETRFFSKAEDGIHFVRQRIGQGIAEGKPPKYIWNADMSPPPLLYPYKLEPGTSWKNEYSVAQHNEGRGFGGAGRGRSSRAVDEISVGGWEKVVVPAGTFRSVPVTVKTRLRAGRKDEDRDITVWFAPGVGIVKTDYAFFWVKRSGKRKKKPYADIKEELVEYRIN